MDADSVGAFKMIGRRWRNFVVDRSQKCIAADHLEARWIWILPILHDPHATSFIPRHKERLSNVRIAKDKFYTQVFRRQKMLDGFGGRQRIRVTISASDVFFNIVNGVDFQIDGFGRSVCIGDRLSRVKFELSRFRFAPRRVVARTILPDAFQTKGLHRGFVHQNRRSHAEVWSRIILIDSNCDRVKFTCLDERCINGVAALFSETTAKLWRKGSRGTNGLSTDVGRASIIQSFREQR